MTTTNQKRAFTVIVGVDYSDTSALALIEAIKAARSREHNHVHVVHTMSPVQTVGPMVGAYIPPVLDSAKVADELKQFVEKTLVEVQRSLPDDGRPIVDRLTTHLGISDPREAIAQLASDLDADLVVIGTHGRRGVSRFLLGSVAEGVVRIAPCPVLVVRPCGTAASKVPEIEPPCPRCVESRRASEGKEFWCAQHREHHDRRHAFHFGPVRNGHQSGFLIPFFH
jgi:nucleotide-binding universal stress UspA family protein